MSSARRGFGQHSPGKLVCASMASNIYHPLPAFYFILVAVIWCSASVTRRYAPPPCSSPVPSTTKKSPDRSRIPVDIPTGWEPRTNQSPTGALIAFAALGTCCSRPVPSTTKKSPDRSRIPVDIPTDWEPRTNQSPTGALVTFAALGRAVRVLYRPPQKNPQTKWSGDRGGRYRTRTCDLLHVKQMLYQLS